MSSAFSSTSLKNHPGLDEWISVGKNGRIAIRTGKVDIGQRISTALAIIAAEELDVDMSRIDVIRTVTGEAPDEGITSGSNSMMESGSAVGLPLRPHAPTCCPGPRTVSASKSTRWKSTTG